MEEGKRNREESGGEKGALESGLLGRCIGVGGVLSAGGGLG